MNKIDKFSGEYQWLSNFWISDITIGNITYPSAEHAYVAAKTGDIGTKMLISEINTPGKVKRYGRKIPLVENWHEQRLNVMRDIIYIKFTQDKILNGLLLDTKNAILIEGNNWHDEFWGVCGGRGSNHLGVILMGVRSAINLEIEY